MISLLFYFLRYLQAIRAVLSLRTICLHLLANTVGNALNAKVVRFVDSQIMTLVYFSLNSSFDSFLLA